MNATEQSRPVLTTWTRVRFVQCPEATTETPPASAGSPRPDLERVYRGMPVLPPPADIVGCSARNIAHDHHLWHVLGGAVEVEAGCFGPIEALVAFRIEAQRHLARRMPEWGRHGPDGPHAAASSGEGVLPRLASITPRPDAETARDLRDAQDQRLDGHTRASLAARAMTRYLAQLPAPPWAVWVVAEAITLRGVRDWLQAIPLGLIELGPAERAAAFEAAARAIEEHSRALQPKPKRKPSTIKEDARIVAECERGNAPRTNGEIANKLGIDDSRVYQALKRRLEVANAGEAWRLARANLARAH